ncbi:MAG: hydrogenase [bacterium]|nr:hydrogenase [bacterium]
MNTLHMALIVGVVLTNLASLGSSRLLACITIIGVQGVLVSLLPLLGGAHVTWTVLLFALVNCAVKGGLIPWLLRRALLVSGTRSELDPFVSYTIALLLGVAALGGASWLSTRLPFAGHHLAQYVAPMAFHTMLIGLLLVIVRRTALSQILGYLTLENGIFAFGALFAIKEPWLVQLGVLLDLLAGVFVMGIALFHISRTFDHIDTVKLSALKDQ